MSASPVVELAPGVFRVPTAPADLANAYALRDDDGQVTVVGCGLRRSAHRVVAALSAIGSDPSEVTRIVVTHAHVDHVGGLAGLRARTSAAVAAHEREAAYLRQGRAPGRDADVRAARLVARAPGRRFSPTEVTEEFPDGELLKVAGGLRVLHTPGPTPGHVSLLHEPTGTLLAGGALVHVRGLRWLPAPLCTDAGLTRESARRLADLPVEVAAFTHGPELRTDVRGRLRRLLDEEAGQG